MSEIRCHPQPKVRCICAAAIFVCGASWPDIETVAIRCRGHPFSAGFRYASSHVAPGIVDSSTIEGHGRNPRYAAASRVGSGTVPMLSGSGLRRRSGRAT